MGKTRLVAEGMARAAAAGMVMVRGECPIVWARFEACQPGIDISILGA